MLNSATWSVSMVGLEGAMVEVEAALGGGLPRTVVLGLPDASLNEARERVRAAAVGAKLGWHEGLLTWNLSPANLPKTGSHFDLALAASALGAMRVLPVERLRSYVMVGELGLSGQVRPVRGILPAMLAAQQAGITKAIVPAGQGAEASLVPGMSVHPVATLADMVAVLKGEPVLVDDEAPEVGEVTAPAVPKDFADVHGHAEGKWLMEVAAAGRHHMFLHGPPGVGKTMLASRMTSILPDLEPHEAVEVSALHSLAGIDLSSGLLTRPPYADPHHNATAVSLLGGGSREVKPGAVSLAHRGVLFLDEAPEFSPKQLDALRTPLENGHITIARAVATVKYPARFQLIMAANPCPCGWHGSMVRECTCPPMKVRNYQERISGPVMDRIDIRHHMPALTKAFLDGSAAPGEPSASIVQRVEQARDRQRRRLRGTPWLTNADVPGSYLRKEWPLPDVELLERSLANGTLSARGVDKALKVAWTISDLAGHDTVNQASLRAALAMRMGDMAEVA